MSFCLGGSGYWILTKISIIKTMLRSLKTSQRPHCKYFMLRRAGSNVENCHLACLSQSPESHREVLCDKFVHIQKAISSQPEASSDEGHGDITCTIGVPVHCLQIQLSLISAEVGCGEGTVNGQ